jgi:hypothetical protein
MRRSRHITGPAGHVTRILSHGHIKCPSRLRVLPLQVAWRYIWHDKSSAHVYIFFKFQKKKFKKKSKNFFQKNFPKKIPKNLHFFKPNSCFKTKFEILGINSSFEFWSYNQILHCQMPSRPPETQIFFFAEGYRGVGPNVPPEILRAKAARRLTPAGRQVYCIVDGFRSIVYTYSV